MREVRWLCWHWRLRRKSGMPRRDRGLRSWRTEARSEEVTEHNTMRLNALQLGVGYAPGHWLNFEITAKVVSRVCLAEMELMPSVEPQNGALAGATSSVSSRLAFPVRVSSDRSRFDGRGSTEAPAKQWLKCPLGGVRKSGPSIQNGSER